MKTALPGNGSDLKDALNWLAAGEPKKAEPILRAVLRKRPTDLEALNGLAFVALEDRRFEEAADYLKQVLQILPQDVSLHFRYGVVLLEAKQHEEAKAALLDTIRLQPGFAEAYHKLGIVHMHLNEIELAVEAFRKAVRYKPSFVEAMNDLGNAHWHLGDYDNAKKAFRSALERKPDYDVAMINLSLALFQAHEYADAERLLNSALQSRSETGPILEALGRCQLGMGEPEKAKSYFLRALAINPHSGDYYNRLGHAYKLAGEQQQAVDCFKRAIALAPENFNFYPNLFSTLYFLPDVSQSEFFDLHEQFYQQFESSYVPLIKHPHQNPEPTRRLKIGYVSADFRFHSVAYFFRPLLTHHDRSNVEIYCYYNHQKIDAMTQELKALSDHWCHCLDMTDDALAAQIQRDGIDILIDLTGHFENDRLRVFARKPAPIQMIYLGFPGSSWIKAMDYRITDALADPVGQESYYVEKLLRLPASLWCFQPRSEMPGVTPLPALSNGVLTFGSFNNFNKIDDDCYALWAKLLVAIPSSRLLMVTVPPSDTVRRSVLDKFAHYGVANDRVDMLPAMEAEPFFAAIQSVDIALDPVNVNGATTTCEALWLGVPTLSLVGTRFLQRAGLSILAAAGLPGFAVADPDAFIAKAIEMELNIEQLSHLRMTLREQIANSPLCDADKFARDMEILYRQAWVQWCNEQAVTLESP